METKNTIDNIVENLFYAVPVIHKRLMRIDPPDVDCGIHITRQHIAVLVMLHHRRCPITEIANTFLIPKPRMTYLIKQMAAAGLLKRNADTCDRRRANLELTPRGKKVFLQCDRHLKNHVKELLANLTERELAELSFSLNKLKAIGPRFEERPG
ncbi:MAG: MarR family transcriptional regulator [Dehalococcoidales bacterium]|jgi:DNA-binding MarR family transcriptional regulator